MIDVYDSSRRIRGDGVELVLTDHGSGDPVLMLHGWPDSAHLWRHQIEGLTDRGYRVLAPDLRGFGGSDKPDQVDAYRVSRSVADVLALLDDVRVGRCHVVCHDFGAAVGWALATRVPDRVRSLTAVSLGHPNAFGAAGLRQLQHSWYMFLFQFEGVAEEFLSAGDWAMFRRMVGNHPEAEHWIEDLSRPGALTASLNWYRANFHPRNLVGDRTGYPVCSVPTLGIWSSGDTALTERQMTGSQDHVTGDWHYQRLEGASHWIPLDAPSDLNSLLIDWLGRY